ncbi:hypothetical protein [Psychrobacillus sp. OK032]|nr:hypothetical protein [Psychrobacillus sp. OK032]
MESTIFEENFDKVAIPLEIPTIVKPLILFSYFSFNYVPGEIRTPDRR